MARKAKFWFDSEKKIMRRLNLKPQPMSGAGYLHKEDGENDELLVQLKSTEAKSISVSRQLWRDLVFHADTSHKTPVLVLDLLGDVLLVCCEPQDLEKVSKSMKGGNDGEDNG